MPKTKIYTANRLRNTNTRNKKLGLMNAISQDSSSEKDVWKRIMEEELKEREKREQGK